MARGMQPPNGQALWKAVSPTEKSRISAWNRSPDLTHQGLPARPPHEPVINKFDYAETVAQAGVDLFSAIPSAASTADFSTPAYEVIPYFGENLEDVNAPSMEFYELEDGGFYYNNKSDNPRDFDSGPAPMTVVPTSTTNPERPRTVAAGYDRDQQKLTVIFRDGTYYNYYEVPNTQWQNFKRSRSKGRFILAYLDSHPRGVSDVSTIPSFARETVYRFVRTGQFYRAGYQPGQSPQSRRGGAGAYKSGNLGGTGRKRNRPSTP